ncbi:16606_t:CDS:2, partial [Dentiscutata heterogama]
LLEQRDVLDVSGSRRLRVFYIVFPATVKACSQATLSGDPYGSPNWVKALAVGTPIYTVNRKNFYNICSTG